MTLGCRLQGIVLVFSFLPPHILWTGDS